MKLPWLSGRRKWGAASAGMLASLLLAFSGQVSAGIADTKHNLGSGPGPGGRNQVSDTAEICVFCHTPHGADTSAPAPLWNKRLGANGAPAGGGSYTTYDTLQTPSLDGTVAPVGSISMACLSCHDGTQAMDNIINAPGSGAYQADGGGAEGRNYTWTAAGPGGRMAPGIANLGENLSNDHPIGIQYCGGGISGAGNATSGTCKDGDFVSSAARLKTAAGAGGQQFWIETGAVADGVKTRTDLPLYTRTFAGGVGPSVECGSCHDPHVSEGQAGPNGQTAGATFLRISNSASAVCTSCHVK